MLSRSLPEGRLECSPICSIAFSIVASPVRSQRGIVLPQQRAPRLRLEQEGGATLLVGGEGRPEGSNEAGSFVQLSSLASATTCASPARRSSVRCSASLLVATRKKRSRSPTTPTTARRPMSSLPTSNRHSALMIASTGGFKQSGFGREFGVFGLEAFLEPRQSILDRSFHYS